MKTKNIEQMSKQEVVRAFKALVAKQQRVSVTSKSIGRTIQPPTKSHAAIVKERLPIYERYLVDEYDVSRSEARPSVIEFGYRTPKSKGKNGKKQKPTPVIRATWESKRLNDKQGQRVRIVSIANAGPKFAVTYPDDGRFVAVRK